MQRLVLAILTVGLFFLVVSKAQSATTDPDIDAIRAVADAYISAKPARLREAFLPIVNLYTTDEKDALRGMAGSTAPGSVRCDTSFHHRQSGFC